MSLLDASTYRSSSTPLSTAKLPAEAYVLLIASLPSSYAAAASSPSNAIHFFDKERLRNVQTLQGHASSITTLRSVPNVANAVTHALVSSGKDGTVRVWDERAGSAALRLTASTAGGVHGLLSCDVSVDGLTIAAGTDLHGEDASILYWDPRSPAAPLRTHSSTHADDITAVHFYRPSAFSTSGNGNVLLSVSSDGLVCTSNAIESDEDEAGLHVGNWGCSIAQAGWLHDRAGRPGIWAASDMETFSVWTGELDRLQDVDIRQPSVHRQDLTWVTDYLIGCHATANPLGEADNDLCVFAGSNEGDVALITRPTFADPSAPWVLQRTWMTGHIGVVRAALWDERNNVLLTGGEDSKLHVWNAPAATPEIISLGKSKRVNDVDPMDVDEDGDSNRKKRRA
ncbi:WD40 repeat-like protein [Dichomitus squalens]|uniref:WD40 repeat-like protein n=1 Tax=Dichomitus squalens TaxID=114155 RepID=A0A4Q9QAP5_9APHY|nr:WD40 repeat-like protein [Dichomitus squalens]TBU64176.1 WD40 repeat-like protein [Dichomitus squalens]